MQKLSLNSFIDPSKAWWNFLLEDVTLTIEEGKSFESTHSAWFPDRFRCVGDGSSRRRKGSAAAKRKAASNIPADVNCSLPGCIYWLSECIASGGRTNPSPSSTYPLIHPTKLGPELSRERDGIVFLQQPMIHFTVFVSRHITICIFEMTFPSFSFSFSFLFLSYGHARREHRSLIFGQLKSELSI